MEKTLFYIIGTDTAIPTIDYQLPTPDFPTPGYYISGSKKKTVTAEYLLPKKKRSFEP